MEAVAVVKLYLVQHGEACVKEVDPERPLTDQGKADIERLATFLKQADIQIDRVIHSGKLRAVQTAEYLAHILAPEVKPESSAIINPGDDPKVFDWRSDSPVRGTLVVGHLPFMSRLVSYLVTEDENEPVTAYQPGSVVCLERHTDAHWQISWMIRPELLR